MDAMAESINQGLLYKFLLKPWNDEKLKIDIRMALDHFELVQSNKILNEKVVEQNIALKAANAQLDELLQEKMKGLDLL